MWVPWQPWLGILSSSPLCRLGKYASDAYEIFVLKRSGVQPSDVYLRWPLVSRDFKGWGSLVGDL